MGGRGLISCERCVTSEKNNIGWYIKRSTESLLVQVRNSKIVDAASSVDKIEYKRNKINVGEQRWKNKKCMASSVEMLTQKLIKINHGRG